MRQLKIEKNLTNRDSKSMKSYLSDVASLDMIGPEEEVALTLEIKKGNQEALDKMVKSNLRFVISVAKQYQNLGLDLEDLISEGNLGLIKAAQNFDETKGFKFISYAVWWIRAYIQRAITKNGGTIRLPVQNTSIVKRIDDYISEKYAETGEVPTDEEIIDKLEISSSVFNTNQKLRNLFKINSLNKKINHDESGELLDIIPMQDSINPEEFAEKSNLQQNIFQLIDKLTQREQFVIVNFFQLPGSIVAGKKEIADYLGISYNTVLTIRDKALTRLRRVAMSAGY